MSIVKNDDLYTSRLRRRAFAARQRRPLMCNVHAVNYDWCYVKIMVWLLYATPPSVPEDLATGAFGTKFHIYEEVRMNGKLLGEAIEALMMLRLELHGSVDDSVLETLDKVISDLEAAKNEPNKINTRDVLHLLGTILDKLPGIVEVIRILSDVFK